MLYARPGDASSCVVAKHVAVVGDAAGAALGELITAAKKRTLKTR